MSHRDVARREDIVRYFLFYIYPLVSFFFLSCFVLFCSFSLSLVHVLNEFGNRLIDWNETEKNVLSVYVLICMYNLIWSFDWHMCMSFINCRQITHLEIRKIKWMFWFGNVFIGFFIQVKDGINYTTIINKPKPKLFFIVSTDGRRVCIVVLTNLVGVITLCSFLSVFARRKAQTQKTKTKKQTKDKTYREKLIARDLELNPLVGIVYASSRTIGFRHAKLLISLTNVLLLTIIKQRKEKSIPRRRFLALKKRRWRRRKWRVRRGEGRLWISWWMMRFDEFSARCM